MRTIYGFITLLYGVHVIAHGSESLAPNFATTIRTGVAQYESDFKARTGNQLSDKLLGIKVENAGNAHRFVGISSLDAQQSQSTIYQCDLPDTGSGKCVFQALNQPRPFAKTQSSIALTDFTTAASEALELFESISLIEFVQGLKLWHSNNKVEVIIYWNDTSGTAQQSFMMCHMHGSHFDCHRQPRPGQNEPQE